jgi:hypothetical protein
LDEKIKEKVEEKKVDPAAHFSNKVILRYLS